VYLNLGEIKRKRRGDPDIIGVINEQFSETDEEGEE